MSSKYIIARAAFLLMLLGLLYIDFAGHVSWYWYALLLATYIVTLVYGSYFIQSQFFLKTLWQGNRAKKTIAISFDDGPMVEFTPILLDILKVENARATFFLIGKNIQGNELLVQRMANEGHTIANHSFSHTYWFSLNNSKTIYNDLIKCDQEIERVTGKKPKLFRPPYGVTNPMVAKAAAKGNYHCIGWSIRTYDTASKNAEVLLKKSLKNLEGGDIILFHDWGAHTIGIISEFITEARKRGFSLVTVDELLNINAYCN